MAGKKIIFCADGTWNGPEEQTGNPVMSGADEHGELLRSAITNVVKLFSNLSGHVTPDTLALQSEQEKAFTDQAGNLVQIAKYLHGVGDSANPIVKAFGGAFGLGVIGRIVRGYTFISRNYVAGDAIHIVGFSRGAYTARALAGMIAKVGLLKPSYCDPAKKLDTYRLGIAAWARSRSVMLGGAGKLDEIARSVLELVERCVAAQLSNDALIADIPIKSVAVWDTVGSMGIPEYAGGRRIDVFRFVDSDLSDKVEHGFHAMAINEMRCDFPVTSWNARKNIQQVWFVGAHADVGGGYPPDESRLSDITLRWMTNKLSNLQVFFTFPVAYPSNPQVLGQQWHTPWEDPPFNVLLRTPRKVVLNDAIHGTVKERWDNDVTYRPEAMAQFTAVGLGQLQLDGS